MKCVKRTTIQELDDLRVLSFKALENGVDTLTPDETKVAIDICSYSLMVIVDNRRLVIGDDSDVIVTSLIASECPDNDMMSIKTFIDTVLKVPSNHSLCSYTIHTVGYLSSKLMPCCSISEDRSFIGIDVTLPHGYTFENFWHKYLQHTSYAYRKVHRDSAIINFKNEL